MFEINNKNAFNNFAIELFNLHYNNNKLYNKFCKLIGIKPETIKTIENIPFLPISLFKTHKVLINNKFESTIFMSSGTLGQVRSKHYIVDENLYINSSIKGFEHFYENCEKYAILALLPSYIEQGNSSLIFMVQNLMKKSKHKLNGFYLHNFSELKSTLSQLHKENQKTILFGVSYALLDFGIDFGIDFPELIVMETGGMKGRRKEMIRKELHAQIQAIFSVEHIHSEYSMTELMSQAYSQKEGFYQSPPWMKILIRDINDPFNIIKTEQTGGINIIDFANIYSCPFIATDDIGVMHSNRFFEVLGRLDASDARGCNIMLTDIDK